MRYRFATSWIVFLIPLTCLGSKLTLPYFDSKELTPYWPKDQDTMSQDYSPATVTPFQVIDQEGRLVTETRLKNQISLVSFFFADCPMLCPTMMTSIKRLQKSLLATNPMPLFFSFSVKPESDSPKKLRQYAKSFGINLANWSLLTGDRKEIYRIGKEVFKADGSVGPQKSESSFIHTKNLYLVDSDLRIRGIYDTDDSKAMALLKKDIAQLQSEIPSK